VVTLSPTEQITLQALLLGRDEGAGLGLGGEPVGYEAHGTAPGLQLVGIDEVREVAGRR
jgi:hypothetical protein